MRRIMIVGLATIVAGCSKTEAPAVDTAAMAPVADAAPAGLTLESAQGRWNMQVMALDNDSVLTTHVLNASADPAQWSITQPTGATVAMRNVTAAGDSIVTQAGPFDSGVRQGMRVRELNTVYRMDGASLVGRATARYETTTADSVRQFRFVGTK